MGIPSFFSYIIKNYPNIIHRIGELKCKVNNLYLDSNSIIYDSMRLIPFNPNFEQNLIKQICNKIDEYISIIKPDNSVIIAFDGVAPVAKLEQQRGRRYKSAMTKQILNEIKEETQMKWDQTAITPGTKFMIKMGKKITSYYKKKSKKFGVKNIIVSDSQEIGEGEHKIFQYIRDHKVAHKKQISVIYGLDADLIMLCLNHLHISKNIYLYRETPEFIKSINADLIPNEHYILNIPLLKEGIINEMSNTHYKNSDQLMFDYIFLCFFLGNDFMPHFPALNIRTNGLRFLLNAYKISLNKNDYFTDGYSIIWGNVRKFVEYLAGNEWDYLVGEYKIREKWEKRYFPHNTEKKREQRFLNIPLKNRQIEHFINPHQSGWEERYYQKLFGIDITDEYRKIICVNYLEGLEWTFKYYTSGCVDWRWYYHYDYPPLLKDLLKYIPNWGTDMIEKNTNVAVSPYVQLSYVLPKNSLHLLPKKIHKKLLDEMSDLYKTDCDFVWAYCKYFWECHPKLPHIHLNKLEKFVESIK